MKIRNKIIIAGAASLIALAAVAQATRTYSVRALPPAVVKTVPVAGSTDVDPGLKEITVTFSKDMQDGSWSIPQTTPSENFPEIPAGAKIHYQPDKRTCVMPVKLESGRTYVVWFNHGQYQNFRDTARLSAVPYMLVFETKK